MHKLPYPGYTWSFTQHAVGLEPDTLYKFLECASVFEGKPTRGLRDLITPLMVELGILTPNNRDGVNDAWRDYQQVLSELGLIYSTKKSPFLILTEIGKMFLAGELGFSELIGIQALRYQYPNGQKSIIQSRLRKELQRSKNLSPQTLVELQTESHVLVKPGALILRVLLELVETSGENFITVDECQAFLLPCKSNAEWSLALSSIKKFRLSTRHISNINRHSRRNIQDWFKFLHHSDLFEISNSNTISLTNFSLSNIDTIKIYCEKQQSNHFWVPSKYDNASFLTWFEYFGSLPLHSQDLIVSQNELTLQYVEKNYIRGLSEDIESENKIDQSRPLNLQNIDLTSLARKEQFKFEGDISLLANNIINGAQKRYSKTLLHDRIIKELAERFSKQGAHVMEDKNSIDLFAKWPSGDSAIFEVKTVTSRSLQARLRSAVGQIKEYGFRQENQYVDKSDQVIVINIDLPENSWHKEFLNDYMGIGLICQTKTNHKCFIPSSAKTGKFWN